MEASWAPKALVLIFLCDLHSQINATLYKSIVWSPENPIFAENKLKCVSPKSMLNIICPSLSVIVADTERAPIKENLYENLWLVDQVAFDSCHVTKQDKSNKKLFVCDTPLELKSYTITFNEISPTLLGLEFEPGKDYYIVATSDGTQNSLGNTKGGHCKTNNMKMRFHMCNDSKDPHCLSEEACQKLVSNQTNIHSDPGNTAHEPEINCNSTMISPSPPNVPRDSFPPNKQHLDSSKEVQYRLAVGLLLLLCLSLLVSSLCLGYRLHRQKKQQSSSIESTKFQGRMSRTSEAAYSVNGEDSSMLISRRNSNKV